MAILIRRKLLRWYDGHHRDLPWRRTRDPYRIWVSEIMLQQTRVQAVIPYYEKFLRRFPDVRSLAAADGQELLACWSGLGYYSRARNLQRAAQAIVSRHGGRFPRELDEALALAGIGSYTAAAVLSIAYDSPLAVLDGNVARVLSRLFAMAADLRTNSGKQRLLKQAGILLAPRRPGDFNQAMMELGATVCLPQQPRCGDCPLRKNCRAFTTNQVGKYPPSKRAARPTPRRYQAALILDGKGNCLLTRRAASERWMAGFWELPTEEIVQGSNLRKAAAMSKNGIVLGALVGHLRHTITTNNLDVTVYWAKLKRSARRQSERWVRLSEVDLLPLTTITRKALRLKRLEASS
jgi:A/G-specific adenine glycosylase